MMFDNKKEYELFYFWSIDFKILGVLGDINVLFLNWL